MYMYIIIYIYTYTYTYSCFFHHGDTQGLIKNLVNYKRACCEPRVCWDELQDFTELNCTVPAKAVFCVCIPNFSLLWCLYKWCLII